MTNWFKNLFKSCEDGKHKYEARYDLRLPTNLKKISAVEGPIEELIEASKELIYVHDICIKCGKIIKA